MFQIDELLSNNEGLIYLHRYALDVYVKQPRMYISDSFKSRHGNMYRPKMLDETK